MYATKLIPNYCRLCLNRQHCSFNFQYDIQNNDHHGQCPHFVLQVGKLTAKQYNRFNNYYELHRTQWCRELELNFVKNMVESASYR